MSVIDLESYRHYLDEFDMTDSQKFELVNAIHVIVESVLDEHFKSKAQNKILRASADNT